MITTKALGCYNTPVCNEILNDAPSITTSEAKVSDVHAFHAFSNWGTVFLFWGSTGRIGSAILPLVISWRPVRNLDGRSKNGCVHQIGLGVYLVSPSGATQNYQNLHGGLGDRFSASSSCKDEASNILHPNVRGSRKR